MHWKFNPDHLWNYCDNDKSDSMNYVLLLFFIYLGYGNCMAVNAGHTNTSLSLCVGEFVPGYLCRRTAAAGSWQSPSRDNCTQLPSPPRCSWTMCWLGALRWGRRSWGGTGRRSSTSKMRNTDKKRGISSRVSKQESGRGWKTRFQTIVISHLSNCFNKYQPEKPSRKTVTAHSGSRINKVRVIVLLLFPEFIALPQIL